jgi:hypothetical protein
MTRDERIEALARAMCVSAGANPDALASSAPPMCWATPRGLVYSAASDATPMWMYWRGSADAALDWMAATEA